MMKYISREGNELFNLEQFTYISFGVNKGNKLCMVVERDLEPDVQVLESYTFKQLEEIAEDNAINLKYFAENQSEEDYMEILAQRLMIKFKEFIKTDDKRIFEVEKEVINSIRNSKALNFF